MDEEKELITNNFDEKLDDVCSEFGFDQYIYGVLTFIPFAIIATSIDMDIYQIILVGLGLMFVINLAASIVKAIKILIHHTVNELLVEMKVMLTILVAYPSKQRGEEVNPFEEVQNAFDWCEKMSK